MQIQTALFFETPEEIFARVFGEIRPGLAPPEVTIQYPRYANANSSIRLETNRLQVKLADVLAAAPAPILEALAQILISKLFRRRPPGGAAQQFRLYLNRKDVRGQLHIVKQMRGRKFVSGPQGGHYNLEEMFARLNEKFFHGLMAQPRLGWTRRRSRSMLGHYDPSHNAIILSRLLDDVEVPPIAVEYVMFHEMLHLQHPVEHNGARRCVHTREFKLAERQFPGLREAKTALKVIVASTA
jgi:hypothetical protein